MSRCGHYSGYNDEWIIDNLPKHTSWKSLFDEYYKLFEFGNYRNFRNHLYNDLGMTRCFTKEQDDWLRYNYPNLGAEEATKQFCKIFRFGRSKHVIVCRASKLGLKVREEVSKKARSDANPLSLPIGAIVVRTNSQGNKTVWVKTENGWARQTHVVIGDIPKGKIVVHYDGDFTNNAPDNLCVITKSVNARMTVNKFWSEDPDITKSGILCCELEELLKEENYGTD